MIPISQLYESMSFPAFNKLSQDYTVFPKLENLYPVYIKENLFSPEECDTLSANLLNPDIPKKVFAAPYHSDEIRKAAIFTLSPEDKEFYRNRVYGVYKEIEDFFNIDIVGSSEGCKGMIYPKGGKFTFHADNCEQTFDNTGACVHVKVYNLRRTISTILILTDSVEKVDKPFQGSGGDLTFNYIFDKNYQMLRFKAKKGLFLAFPSHAYFSHQIHTVTDGMRISIVDWLYARKLT